MSKYWARLVSQISADFLDFSDVLQILKPRTATSSISIYKHCLGLSCHKVTSICTGFTDVKADCVYWKETNRQPNTRIWRKRGFLMGKRARARKPLVQYKIFKARNFWEQNSERRTVTINPWVFPFRPIISSCVLLTFHWQRTPYFAGTITIWNVNHAIISTRNGLTIVMDNRKSATYSTRREKFGPYILCIQISEAPVKATILIQPVFRYTTQNFTIWDNRREYRIAIIVFAAVVLKGK